MDALSSPTIFIVEDDDAVRDSIQALVQSCGYQTAAFSSAEQFLAQAAPTVEGCVISDVRMPGISGLELLDEIKRRALKLRVVLITAFADVPMAVRAMQSGAVTFLEKPFENPALLAGVEQALNFDHAQRQAQNTVADLEQRLATLSADERVVLGRILEGMPNKRIASDLDIGLRTVELRRANIMKKMGADSLAQLVRMTLFLEMNKPAANPPADFPRPGDSN